jgi:hypothetical protein
MPYGRVSHVPFICVWVRYLILNLHMHLIQQRNNRIHSMYISHTTSFTKWSQKTGNSHIMRIQFLHEGNGCRPSTAGSMTTTYNESVSGKTLNAIITTFFTTSYLLKSDVPGHYLETTFQIHITFFEATLRCLISMFKRKFKQPSEFRHLGKVIMYCYDPLLKTWWNIENQHSHLIINHIEQLSSIASVV